MLHAEKWTPSTKGRCRAWILSSCVYGNTITSERQVNAAVISCELPRDAAGNR